MNYREIHTGSNQPLSEGSTAVSQHIAHNHHQKGDITIKAIGYEKNRQKRRFKEALAIYERNPSLNKMKPDPNPVYVPIIYQNLPSYFPKNPGKNSRSSLLVRSARTGGNASRAPSRLFPSRLNDNSEEGDCCVYTLGFKRVYILRVIGSVI